VSLRTYGAWTYFGSPRSNPPVNPVVQNQLQIVRGEYLEIPGLRLTRVQLQHLWDLDDTLCDDILDTLVSVRFLERTSGGAFVRAVGARS
jgi:hypothetical protein